MTAKMKKRFNRYGEDGWLRLYVNGKECFSNGHFLLPGALPDAREYRWCAPGIQGSDQTKKMRRWVRSAKNRVTIKRYRRAESGNRIKEAVFSNGGLADARYLKIIEDYCGPLEWFQGADLETAFVGKRNSKVYAILMPRRP